MGFIFHSQYQLHPSKGETTKLWKQPIFSIIIFHYEEFVKLRLFSIFLGDKIRIIFPFLKTVKQN